MILEPSLGLGDLIPQIQQRRHQQAELPPLLSPLYTLSLSLVAITIKRQIHLRDVSLTNSL